MGIFHMFLKLTPGKFYEKWNKSITKGQTVWNIQKYGLKQQGKGGIREESFNGYKVTVISNFQSSAAEYSVYD